jgi:hypothetical protein
MCKDYFDPFFWGTRSLTASSIEIMRLETGDVGHGEVPDRGRPDPMITSPSIGSSALAGCSSSSEIVWEPSVQLRVVWHWLTGTGIRCLPFDQT